MAIKIYSDLQQIAIDAIVPNNWNPNSVPPDIEAAIKDDIEKNGFLRPLVVQSHNAGMDKDYVIIDGEHRWKIMKELGESVIPCIVMECPDDTAKALTIRLNREHGELLPNRVGELLWDMSKDNGRDIDFLHEITMIPSGELQTLIDIRDNDLAESMKNTDRTAQPKLITCPECGHQFERGAKKEED